MHLASTTEAMEAAKMAEQQKGGEERDRAVAEGRGDRFLAAGEKPKAVQKPFKTSVRSVQVQLKSWVLSLSDGDYDHFVGKIKTLPVPLLEVCFSEVSLQMHQCIFVDPVRGHNPYMAMKITEFLDRYTSMKAFHPPFNKLTVKL